MKMHKEQPGQGYEAQALFVSERSRARNLLELLSEANADVRRGVDPSLLRRESELREILEGKSTAQGRLLATSKPNSATLAALSQEISTLTEEYEQVRARIRRTSPSYASLTQPAPLNARDIQGLLDKDTVLLEYALGDTNSFLWLVTPDSVTVYNLPNRVEIETAARRYYELLTARNEAKLPKSDAQVNEAGKALGEMLLRPVADRLGSKRLVIIAEGALQYIPFASLTKPAAETKASISTADSTDATKFLSGLLIEANEIIYLPSASTLSVLRREWSNRKGATKTFAVLADPVFSLADPRVKATQSKLPQLKNQKIATTRSREEARDKDLQRSLNDAVDDLAGLQTISRLPFSRREAEAIAQIVPTKDTFKALDFAASTEKATGGNLADYKIVHFATHGLLNSKNPALSGLILSLVNARGEPQNGFLRLNDIYNLRLNSDLVVLSACQTALGKDIRGEGLIGLTRGFMYAGAPRVVASLWKVDDAATAELMKRFYRNMLAKNSVRQKLCGRRRSR
jgi:CHAT domain-containing protein